MRHSPVFPTPLHALVVWNLSDLFFLFFAARSSLLGHCAILREKPLMGVLQPRGRRDSRASALSRSLGWDRGRDPDASIAPESLVEHAHANLGSSAGAGTEASSYNASSMRTPSRSFYHRSFNAPTGRPFSSPFSLPPLPPLFSLIE